MLILTVKTILGFTVFISSFLGLLANLIVLRPVYKFAKSPEKSTIYVISLFNILNDIIQLLLSTFYLAPCIIFETYIFGDKINSPIPVFLGACCMFSWYIGNVSQIVMATNRFAVICYRNYTFFTRRNTTIIFILTIIGAAAKSFIIQYVFPCCEFIFDHHVLSYNYVVKEGITNYSDLSDIPVNALSTIVAFVCYTSIIFTIRKSTKTVSLTMTAQTQRQRRHKEYIYAMQFFSISLFYTFAWVFLRTFPMLFGGENLEWFVLIAFSITVNSSANAFIYLISNKEIIRMISRSRYFVFGGTSSTIHHSDTIPQSSEKRSKIIAVTH
ncbi:unnamed protein product [Caenorhabditis angaria]|uniref:7TM GPCR serpentine receptor class x (Srx) domain-containing protein n=1 Tax=Caenorhabditis angaria TaxID=860376 RepID=A0A9P1N8Z9_9PELO|nr:unnamed protein product [Caenorhabditis angaria]